MPWTPTDADIAQARTQHVLYDRPPPWTGHATSCSHGLSPGAVALCTYLRTHARTASHCGGYECAENHGLPGTTSVHGTGRALDVFPHGTADGDAIASWLVTHAAAIGVQFVIWNGTQWSSGHGFTAYPGANPHTDHVHLELTRAGAAMDTPFFGGGGRAGTLVAIGVLATLGYVFRDTLAAWWRG